MTLASRTLRIAGRSIRVSAPMDLLEAALGNLDVFQADAGEPDVVVEVVRGGVPPAVANAPAPEDDPASRVSYAGGRETATIACAGLGIAELPARGPVRLHVVEGAGGIEPDETLAELLTVPALAERLRRVGVSLVHGAVLCEAKRLGRAWLVPAARGGGKTTLALSLRGRGFTMLCDDRCWMFDGGGGPLVDPFPEPPRVGDRSLFLLPPGIAPGPRDPRTGKAPVPGLAPPRLPEPLPLAGCLVPRLVDGPGGATRRVTGALALAALVSQGVVATDPAATTQTLARYASWLTSHPIYEVEVGDDPSRAASAVAALSLL